MAPVKKKKVSKKPVKKKVVKKKSVTKKVVKKPVKKKVVRKKPVKKVKLKKIRPEPIITSERKTTKIVSGVSQSIADSLGIDVNIVRIGFVISSIFLIGIPIYFLLSLIMKD